MTQNHRETRPFESLRDTGEERVELFEAAWQQEGHARIEQYLPPRSRIFWQREITQHTDNPFKECSNEVLPPLKTDVLIGCKKASWKTAPQPDTSKVTRFRRFNLIEQERSQIKIGNSPGKGFRVLAYQIASGGAEN